MTSGYNFSILKPISWILAFLRPTGNHIETLDQTFVFKVHSFVKINLKSQGGGNETKCCQVDKIFEQKMSTNIEQANMNK